MATVTESTAIERIGQAAGLVFHYLQDQGPTNITKLVKEVDAPRDTVQQALGWLAREDKINIDEESRSRVVSLR